MHVCFFHACSVLSCYVWMFFMYIVCIYMYVFMYMYICMCVCIYACPSVCIYACVMNVLVQTFVCMIVIYLIVCLVDI